VTERSFGSERILKIDGPRGRADVDLRVPGLAEVRYVGLATTELAEGIHRRLDAWIAAGMTVTIYIDASELKSYETAFRTVWTGWFRANRPRLAAVHILFQSKLIEMGISIANSFLGGFLVPWSDRRGFEASLAKARSVHRERRPVASYPDPFIANEDQ
jgi:hypothetical protein